MRHIVLEGAHNVRDLGGYRTVDGRTVATGKVFRADGLAQLTDADLTVLGKLGLHTVVDFRTESEKTLSGLDRLPPGLEPVALPVGGGDLALFYEVIMSGDPVRQQETFGGGAAAGVLIEVNRSFVTDPAHREEFGTALRLVADGALPLMFHCTGGKDRTGWMAALLLTLLGVPHEDVVADYMLSNELHAESHGKLLATLESTGQMRDADLLRPLLEQDPAYLETAFTEARKAYGSIEAYVHSGLGAQPETVARLRRRLLDPEE